MADTKDTERAEVAREIWGILQWSEGRPDAELEDLPETHAVWKMSNVAILAMRRLAAKAGPVAEVFSMFPVAPGGAEKLHVTLLKQVPAGTKLYSAPQPVSGYQQALDIRTAQGWTLGGKAVPVLYTDTINGEQVMRDDVWLCTTAALAPHTSYSMDADPQGIRAMVADTITGALAFGAQGVNPPPEGHWLTPFWNAARADAASQPADAADGWVSVPREATEEMKAAAVKYANGPAVYKNVKAEVLRIEEGIYGEAYEAMVAAAPPSQDASKGGDHHGE
ncbi:hypothetical protein [Paracidovorax wautersii]|uniref:RecT family protein n=1 Tax=Paracidovorax wautersii TaxID=1177982 RepID=A0ABU1IGH3_9BURK|nr:hypothetical protein [Paracidovorax wautersii]MDR6216230.1 hypothetical protein [Paracidovorax wautersii]